MPSETTVSGIRASSAVDAEQPDERDEKPPGRDTDRVHDGEERHRRAGPVERWRACGEAAGAATGESAASRGSGWSATSSSAGASAVRISGWNDGDTGVGIRGRAWLSASPLVPCAPVVARTLLDATPSPLPSRAGATAGGRAVTTSSSSGLPRDRR